jgi:predicted AAA+ superfamily ATPase
VRYTKEKAVILMKRSCMENLIEWKNRESRKPLLINGARQVGKTWLVKKFGEENFENVAYVNFDLEKDLLPTFESSLDPIRIINALEIYLEMNIEQGKTLIIFDEVQELPRALTSLKYFNEFLPDMHIIATGSFLGVSMHHGVSYPVGKIETLQLFPLTFEEFLMAINKKMLIKPIHQLDFSLIQGVKHKYEELLRSYYFVGGMPEVVKTYIENNDLTKVRQVQKRLLTDYEHDFSKHAPSKDIPKIRYLWNSIPSQLAREQKKFMYGLVKEGARAREYEFGIQWLIDSGLVYKISRVVKPQIPLLHYMDLKAFKLYVLDVGLLSALSDVHPSILLQKNKILEEFKGALTEQYVLQELISSNHLKPYYWSSNTSKAEVEFVVQDGSSIFPIEVKAEENLKAKSLKSYHSKYNPKKSFRISMSSFKDEGWLANLPLYTIGILYRYIRKLK